MRDLLSLLLALLDDEVTRPASDDALDFKVLVAGNDGKAGRLGADRLVLWEGERDRLGAVDSAAFADETDGHIGLGLELFGHL